MLNSTPPPRAAQEDEWWSRRTIGRLTAPILDRLADAELQHGHHARAEFLATLANEMRVS
jgi:hypothetical protein